LAARGSLIGGVCRIEPICRSRWRGGPRSLAMSNRISRKICRGHRDLGPGTRLVALLAGPHLIASGRVRILGTWTPPSRDQNRSVPWAVWMELGRGVGRRAGDQVQQQYGGSLASPCSLPVSPIWPPARHTKLPCRAGPPL